MVAALVPSKIGVETIAEKLEIALELRMKETRSLEEIQEEVSKMSLVSSRRKSTCI